MDETIHGREGEMSTKNITLIIGLPRSRTAWLSVALSHGDCYAFHDASNPPDSCDAGEYLRRLSLRQEKNVVDCSSALLMNDGFVAACDAPIILIERDPDDACDAFANHIRDARLVHSVWPVIERKYAELRQRFAKRIVATVKFTDLADSNIVRSIFSIIAPNEQFDLERCEHLQKLNIQERKPSWAGD
jgi:hypothetical protein